MSPKIVRSVGIFLCAACLIASAFVGSTYYRQRQVQNEAEEFLGVLKALDLRSMTPDEIADLARRYHGIIPTYAPPCSVQFCQYDFVFDNKLLSSLRLAPYTQFGSSIMFGSLGVQLFTSGLVVGIVDPPRGQPHLAVLIEEKLTNEESTNTVEVTHDGGSLPWRMRTRLWSGADRELRRQAYDFHLDCLSRLRGCRTLDDLMKSAWPPTGGSSFQR